MRTTIFKLLGLFFLITVISSPISAQKYLTKTGHAYFMSHTDVIDIDGNNNLVGAVVDAETGDIFVKVLIKAFEFTLATADTHFNETYMESDKFPSATYKGKIPMLPNADLSEDAEYDVETEGKLSIHGITRDIKQAGKLIVKNGEISIKCDFVVSIEDYKIEVPKLVKDRVAKQVDVNIDLTLLPKS